MSCDRICNTTEIYIKEITKEDVFEIFVKNFFSVIVPHILVSISPRILFVQDFLTLIESLKIFGSTSQAHSGALKGFLINLFFT